MTIVNWTGCPFLFSPALEDRFFLIRRVSLEAHCC